jgi:hypothetical protein
MIFLRGCGLCLVKMFVIYRPHFEKRMKIYSFIQAESESDDTTAAGFVPSDWSTFLISNGLSDLPFLYSLMVRFAEDGPANNFETVRKPIGHLKAAIGCLIEVLTFLLQS